VLCGAATSSDMLIVGRAVAGLGAAGIITGAITIISSCAPLEKRPGKWKMALEMSSLKLSTIADIRR
jgi:MFS family permease